MPQKANKTLYIFLCALMGTLIFLIIHRTLVLLYSLMLNSNPEVYGFGMSFTQLSMLEYYTLGLFLMGGLLYGIWVGEYWYHLVYETGRYAGVIHHIFNSERGTDTALVQVQKEVRAIEKKVAEEVWHLEELEHQIADIPEVKVAPKKRIVRRKTVSKVKKTE